MKATARVIAVLLGIALLSLLAFAQSSATSPTVALTSHKLNLKQDIIPFAFTGTAAPRL